MVEDDDNDEIHLDSLRKIKDRKHYVSVECVLFEELHKKLKGIIATDQTGRFLITSVRGIAYIMVLYDNYRSIHIIMEIPYFML